MDSAIAPDRHSASAERVDSSSVLRLGESLAVLESRAVALPVRVTGTQPEAQLSESRAVALP